MAQHGDDGSQGFRQRRGVIRLLAGTAAALALAPRRGRALDLGSWFGGAAPRAVTPDITANDAFYVVAVDPGFDPGVTPATAQPHWSLQLAGLGAAPQSLDYDSLRNRARLQVQHTLECIGNPVGGKLIGNARWQVLPLKTLLRGLPGYAGARAVRFESLDGFYSSVSIERAVDDYAFLAMGMNGEPLPRRHGFPARVLLPDLYGMKQPRWLKRIALQADATTTSYWERYGWAGEVPVQTTSRLDPPGPLRAGVAATLTGIAYAGRRGVRAVEVSLDDGRHWVPCELLSGPTPDVWSQWRYHWPAPSAGRAVLQVRATDGDGRLQRARVHGVNPAGASGIDRRTVDVSAAD